MKNKVFLFADNDIENNYIRNFLERTVVPNFQLFVVLLYSEFPLKKRKSKQNICYIYLNIPDLSDCIYVEEKMSKLGDRIVDYLIFEGYVNRNEKICFCFANPEHYFIQRAIKERMNPFLISAFSIHHLKHANKFPNNLDNLSYQFDEKSGHSFRRKYYDHFEYQFLKNSDLILINSDRLIEFLKNLYSLNDEKLVNWHYSVNINEIKTLSGEFNFRDRNEKYDNRLIVFKVDKYVKADYNEFFKYLSTSDRYRCIVVGECQLKIIPSEYKVRSKIIFINDITSENEKLILPFVDLFVIEEGKSNEYELLLKFLFLKVPVLAINKGYKFDDFRKLLEENEKKSHLHFSNKISEEKFANYIEWPSGFFHFLPNSFETFSEKTAKDFLNQRIKAFHNADK